MSIRQGNNIIASGKTKSYTPNILDFKWSDHIINDIQWLRSDTFSWQSGAVYQTAYQHLVDDYNSVPETTFELTLKCDDGEEYIRFPGRDGGDFYCWSDGGLVFWYTKTLSPGTVDVYMLTSGGVVGTGTITGDVFKQSETETIGDTTITFYRATDGHKIVLPDQEANVEAIFSATGVAWYYILDTTNQRFKLPRKKNRFIVEEVKGENWYRLYSDGWLEQGGVIRSGTMSSNNITLTLLKGYANNNYYINGKYRPKNQTVSYLFDAYELENLRTNTSCVFRCCSEDNYWAVSSDFNIVWEAKGYASVIPDVSCDKHLYFYVGEYAQTAIEQTAGLNSELFNGKADVDLSNTNPSSTFKEMSVGWGMPDYSAGIDITVTLYNNKSYTAPSKGVLFNAMIPQNNTPIKINGNTIGIRSYSTYGNWIPTPYYLDAGDVFSASSFTGTSGGAYFFPLKGAI